MPLRCPLPLGAMLEINLFWQSSIKSGFCMEPQTLSPLETFLQRGVLMLPPAAMWRHKSHVETAALKLRVPFQWNDLLLRRTPCSRMRHFFPLLAAATMMFSLEEPTVRVAKLTRFLLDWCLPRWSFQDSILLCADCELQQLKWSWI